MLKISVNTTTSGTTVATDRLDEVEALLAQSRQYGEMAYDDWGLSNVYYVAGLLALAKNEVGRAEDAMRQAQALLGIAE